MREFSARRCDSPVLISRLCVKVRGQKEENATPAAGRCLSGLKGKPTEQVSGAAFLRAPDGGSLTGGILPSSAVKRKKSSSGAEGCGCGIVVTTAAAVLVVTAVIIVEIRF